MIEFVTGDLFKADVEAIVNAVNCDGIMWEGLALAFKKKYPRMNEDYEKACFNRSLKVGFLHTYQEDKLIINFPAKDKVALPSEMSYIKDVLIALKALIESQGIKSIAIPALGCGLGGLDWDEVKPLIVEELKDVKAKILIFEPY